MKQKNSFSGQIGFVFAAAGRRSRRGKPLAFSISGSKRRGRTFPDHLSCAGIDGWFCVTDYRYSNWPQDGEKAQSMPMNQ